MRGCNNSKIHISSNFILSICLLIMFITQQHLATLNHTTPNYTSLLLSTLHFLSFTLHYSPIWLNPSTFPIVLFHLTLGRLSAAVDNRPWTSLLDIQHPDPRYAPVVVTTVFSTPDDGRRKRPKHVE